MLSLADLIHIFFSLPLVVEYVARVFFIRIVYSKRKKSSLIFLTFEYAYLFLWCATKRIGAENFIRIGYTTYKYMTPNITEQMVWAAKCFGFSKRKSNISRNNHFAVIVGASIGPCQRQVMTSFTFFLFLPTRHHCLLSVCVFVVVAAAVGMCACLLCEIVGGCCYFSKK